MRTNKIADTFVATLDALLATEEHEMLINPGGLVTLDALLSALAPNHRLLTLRDVTNGIIVGFVAKHTLNETNSNPPEQRIDLQTSGKCPDED